eukprot:TRINITY_DN93113_c0_g1_i1.p1 TRINITY_DN93113_c0_g1~~TRINITY_DN93113_c0_g1_i1.p1  ORF type:complete len:398 (+),score=59.65 TRINITY_DN93113_c0_g1_i1:57-1250(+)
MACAGVGSAAPRGNRPATLLLALNGRIRRISLSSITLADLRSVIFHGCESGTNPASIRISSEPDGSFEIVSDAELCNHVSAGRLLHVLGTAGPCNISVPDSLSISTSSLASSRMEAAGGLSSAPSIFRPALGTRDPHESARLIEDTSTTSSIAMADKDCSHLQISDCNIMQHLVEERDARRAGEAELRRFTESLHRKCLDMFTTLDVRLDSLASRMEESKSTRVNLQSHVTEATQSTAITKLLQEHVAAVEARLESLETGMLRELRVRSEERQGQDDTRITELSQSVGRLQQGLQQTFVHLRTLCNSVHAVHLGASRHAAEVSKAMADLDSLSIDQPPGHANSCVSSEMHQGDTIAETSTVGTRGKDKVFGDPLGGESTATVVPYQAVLLTTPMPAT